MRHVGCYRFTLTTVGYYTTPVVPVRPFFFFCCKTFKFVDQKWFTNRMIQCFHLFFLNDWQDYQLHYDQFYAYCCQPKAVIRADYVFQKEFLFLLGKQAQSLHIWYRSYDDADIYSTQTGNASVINWNDLVKNKRSVKPGLHPIVIPKQGDRQFESLCFMGLLIQLIAFFFFLFPAMTLTTHSLLGSLSSSLACCRPAIRHTIYPYCFLSRKQD